ncbi:antibiotic biosynthesis monooxygenase family protein [Porticoccus sp.]
MYAVIFRATVGALDEEYFEAIERMKVLAFEEYGCLEFYALMDGDRRVAISYWNSEDDIKNWKQNSEHLKAQASGRKKWYESYTVQVVKIHREYSHNSEQVNP